MSSRFRDPTQQLVMPQSMAYLDQGQSRNGWKESLPGVKIGDTAWPAVLTGSCWRSFRGRLDNTYRSLGLHLRARKTQSAIYRRGLSFAGDAWEVTSG